MWYYNFLDSFFLGGYLCIYLCIYKRSSPLWAFSIEFSHGFFLRIKAVGVVLERVFIIRYCHISCKYCQITPLSVSRSFQRQVILNSMCAVIVLAECSFPLLVYWVYIRYVYLKILPWKWHTGLLKNNNRKPVVCLIKDLFSGGFQQSSTCNLPPSE